MSYLPPTGELSHLMTLISDAEGTQRRIKELNQATAEHIQAVQKHQDEQRQTKAIHDSIISERTKLQGEIIQHQNQVAIDRSYIEDRKRELDNTIRDIANRNENLKQREQNVLDKAKQLDLMHAQLVNREVDISTRTKMVEGREQQVQQHAARNNALIDHLRQNGFLSS